MTCGTQPMTHDEPDPAAALDRLECTMKEFMDLFDRVKAQRDALLVQRDDLLRWLKSELARAEERGT